MKRKIFGFLFILASIIACAVCAVACNEEVSREDYVGKYEFAALEATTKVNDETQEKKFAVGENGVGKNFIFLELKEDDTYRMVKSSQYSELIKDGQGSEIKGKWSLTDGNLAFDNSGFGDGILKGTRLTFDMVYETEIQQTKVVSEIKLAFNKISCDEGYKRARAQLLGKYGFVSFHEVIKIAGEDDIVVDYAADKDEFTKDSFVLELKDDWNYVLTSKVEDTVVTINGTWTYDRGKICFIPDDVSADNYDDITYNSGNLTLTYKVEDGTEYSLSRELKLFKIV